MRTIISTIRPILVRTTSAAVLATALFSGSAAFAQTTSAQSEDEPSTGQEIVVTGSRLDRPGFEAPTPTTVVGEAELRQGARPSIAQVLNDLPSFRATTSPSTTIGNTNNSASTADLRGLGALRTLTLMNGRRFVGSADLNNVPLSLVKRVEVVTGGASAAWGSGAVAGVVNIILDDELDGLRLGAKTGVSSRGDAARYGLDASFGTSFADGRGHIMIAGEYLKEDGAFGRNSGDRPNLDSSPFTTNGQLSLRNDVNYANATPGGIIMSGVLAGQAFNPNGTLSPFQYGSVSSGAAGALPTATIGGGGRSQYDYLAVTSPYERFNTYARATFEVSDAAKFWIEGGFSRIKGDFGLFPDVLRVTPATPLAAASGGLLVQRDNAYLSTTIRNQLLAAGQTSFRLGRIIADAGEGKIIGYRFNRDNIEAALGVDGNLGGGWKYSAYYGHGELKNVQSLTNMRITANFANALDSVTSPTTGLPICRIALTTPTTACRPINIFGEGNISADAAAYAFGDGGNTSTAKLDTVGASLRGDLFSTWAGPVSIAVGVDARWESNEVTNIDPLSRTLSFATLNFSGLDGKFNVKEAFGEVAVPLLKIDGTAEIELNGAARYSDYSNSGGIWSWKAGVTTRFFDDLRLRAVRSRDIRSPSIGELFTTRTTNLQNVSDPTRNNEVVSITRFGGGNPNLVPEIAKTTTIGGAYSPRFIPGANFSVDFYKIDIDKVIGSLSGQDIINQCALGNQTLCAAIVRDPTTQQITTVFATNLNLASYKTRGIDFEASYRVPLDRISSSMPGTLSFRALATYVDSLKINNGLSVVQRAGIVGDTLAFTTPKWRGTGSINYQSENVGVDLRVRYVGGGLFGDPNAFTNNKVSSRTYVDLGVQFKLEDFELFGTVNNVFDRDPPFVTYSTAIYDVVGTYFSAGVKVKF